MTVSFSFRSHVKGRSECSRAVYHLGKLNAEAHLQHIKIPYPTSIHIICCIFLILSASIFFGTTIYADETEVSSSESEKEKDSPELDSENVESETTEQSDKLVPPKIVEYVKAEYPKEAQKAGLEAEVTAELDIDETGLVTNVQVTKPVGNGFDEAATDALYRFVFTPGLKNGTPIAAKVFYRYRFSLTDAQAVNEETNAEENAVNSNNSETPDNPVQPAENAAGDEEILISEVETEDLEFESLILGARRTEATAAAHYNLNIGELRIIPRKNAAEQLMMAPGVLTTNHGGEGHAHETYMRGFASKEGQDIEFLVDGVPINEIANPHNHGYADLHFIPPEMVLSVAITEGAFDPEQGDFAFAGTAEYRLGLAETGARVSYSYGMRNTQRTLMMYAPYEKNQGSFAGFEYFTTDGYGKNHAAKRALGLGRLEGDLGKNHFKYSLSIYGYAARYDQPGVIRNDDFESKTIGFYDTYDPNQGGESNRMLTSLKLSAGPEDSRFDQLAFVGWRTMRLRVNYTGWMTDNLIDDNGSVSTVQRGDGLEMRYKTVTAGARGSYALTKQLLGQEQQLSLGYAFRFDQGNSEQLRLRSVTAIPYRQVFNNEFTVWNIAGWLRLQLRPFKRLTLRGGVRLDTFSFGITDNNQLEADRDGTRISNQTAQSFGFALNPRVTADVLLVKGLRALVSYGQGTRSTDAAALSDNETAPFAKAQEFDGGFLYNLSSDNDRLKFSSQLSYGLTKVNKDLIFSETEGRNVPAGSSTRHAVLWGTRASIFSILDLLANVGWTRATLDSSKELMPYIPNLVVRFDAALTGNIAKASIGSVPIVGNLGLGFTFVPGRPLPYKEEGDSMHLLSAGGELRLWHFSVGIEMRNMLNRRYREVEFNYASNFVSPNALPSRMPERHFVAGEPFFLMGTITWHIEDMFRGSLKTTQIANKKQEEISIPVTEKRELK